MRPAEDSLMLWIDRYDCHNPRVQERCHPSHPYNRGPAGSSHGFGTSNSYILSIVTTTSSGCATQPNVLILWGDDIGETTVSAYGMGRVGYRTPNIDRLANEGILFTDYYGEQSCTAGRASFITGQLPFRTGLTKVGMPGAKLGLQLQDPTLAVFLKDLGYACGQFGKNHLGDRDEFLPTNHGFDEFFGNLYHLNAEEEPENPDYPKNPKFKQKFGPRGVLRSSANSDGSQTIEDTGPLTRKRMETVDDETTDAAIDFIRRQHASGTPWFVWWNATRMHFRTHVKAELRGISGQNEFADGMVEHDMHVGRFLELLDELGIADQTIVQYSTDNGAAKHQWPDAAVSPFRGEKNTNWEGGWRVPCVARWPGVIKPGSLSNGVVHHMDWLPTILAALGKDSLKEELVEGYSSAALGRDYRIHLDGYNMLEHLRDPQANPSPRQEVFYFSDDGDLTAVRHDDWKMIFMEQRAQGTGRVWSDPFVPLRVPLILNLRRDPFEQATLTSNTYWDWVFSHAFLAAPAQEIVGKFLSTFAQFPPRQKAASFTVDQALEKLQDSLADR